MLLCGLDGAGKTTLIKHYSKALENYVASKADVQVSEEEQKRNENVIDNTEFYYTTPYINIEKIELPESSMPCIVYDLSGQVSIFINNS